MEEITAVIVEEVIMIETKADKSAMGVGVSHTPTIDVAVLDLIESPNLQLLSRTVRRKTRREKRASECSQLIALVIC